jgi:hypothetical protein
MRIEGVPYQNLEFVWEEVAPLIKEVEHPGFTLDDVYKAIMHRNFQLWIVLDEEHRLIAALITEILVYPQLRSMRIVFGAGARAKDWLPKLSELVFPWAKAHGCSYVEIEGRPGWQKLVNAAFGSDWARPQSVVLRGKL